MWNNGFSEKRPQTGNTFLRILIASGHQGSACTSHVRETSFRILLLLVVEQRACHLRIDRVVIPIPSCAVNLAAEHSRRYSAEKCVELSDTLGALKRRPFYWMDYVVSNIEATTQPVSRL